LQITISITDPEVEAELERRAPGPARQEYAAAALRLGILSLRMASGHVDSEGIRRAGEHIAADLSHRLSTELTRYLDPTTGALPHALRRHVGPENSVLAQTLDRLIRGEFSLDRPESALSLLKRQIDSSIFDIMKQHSEFQANVQATLEGLKARKEESLRSTRHGLEFEDAAAGIVAAEAIKTGDLCERVAQSPGLLRNNKTGDLVVELSADSAAPGSRVVWEAKQSQAYPLARALAEIREARDNRGAQLGVFLYSKLAAPPGLPGFSRYGNDLVIVWDAENPLTDVYVQAAHSVTRALAVRQAQPGADSGQALARIEMAVLALGRTAEELSRMETWADTVRNSGDKIAQSAAKSLRELTGQIEVLNVQLAALRGHPSSARAAAGTV
jgi:hypothetical protein